VEPSDVFGLVRDPPFGETRRARTMRSPDMERNELVDYLVGVTFLAVVLIVGLAVLGNQLANALHHA
jgi:hypothetical protein